MLPQMGYGFGTTAEEHREKLIKALHSARWDDDLPQYLVGLNANLLIETAVDELITARDEREQLNVLRDAARALGAEIDTCEASRDWVPLSIGQAWDRLRAVLGDD